VTTEPEFQGTEPEPERTDSSLSRRCRTPSLWRLSLSREPYAFEPVTTEPEPEPYAFEPVTTEPEPEPHAFEPVTTEPEPEGVRVRACDDRA